MSSNGLLDGVESAGVEVGADAAEIQRCTQEGFAHAFAIGCIKVRITFTVFVANGGKGCLLVGKLRGKNIAIANLFTI